MTAVFERFKADAAKPNALEETHQKVIFIWAALNVGRYPCLRWMHSIPNGGSRNLAEASKFKATGLKKGIVDIFLPYPRLTHAGFYSGLYIELKVEKRRNQKNGGCSDDQLEFIDYANKVGYKALVCYGWQEAVKAIEDYLNE